jgi:hypothetical protein
LAHGIGDICEALEVVGHDPCALSDDPLGERLDAPTLEALNASELVTIGLLVVG